MSNKYEACKFYCWQFDMSRCNIPNAKYQKDTESNVFQLQFPSSLELCVIINDNNLRLLQT